MTIKEMAQGLLKGRMLYSISSDTYKSELGIECMDYDLYLARPRQEIEDDNWGELIIFDLDVPDAFMKLKDVINDKDGYGFSQTLACIDYLNKGGTDD